MQKRQFIALSLKAALAGVAALSGAALLTGCNEEKAPSAPAAGSAAAASAAKKAIKVGVTAGPHADIVKKAAEVAKSKEGLEVEVVEFSDYITPDTALWDKALDAAVYQHEPFLNNFNKQNGTRLVVAAPAVVQPMGLYSKTLHAADAVADGAKISIPNDPSNGGRALLLLEQAGLLKLKAGLKDEATVHDVAENPKGLQLIELEAAQLPLSLDDVAVACIPMNYVVSSGLSPEKEGFFFESYDAPYALIIIAARDDNAKSPEIEAFCRAYRSAETAAFIEEKFKGTIRPSWTVEKAKAA